MQHENLVPVEVCYASYNIQPPFVHRLHDHGFIRMQLIEGREYIHRNELAMLEKCMHLHYDLQINMEGLEAIHYLLERVETMQQEIAYLQSRLSAAAALFHLQDSET